MTEVVSSQTPGGASTPSSSANTGLNGASQNGAKASKDRKCEFCKQAFTSSSLGRHLDLYIKPKNPKPADGIHDVDKIRAMRGGITRRQPRVSLKGKHDGDTGSDMGTPISGTSNGHHMIRRLTIGSQDTPGGAATSGLVVKDGPLISPVNVRGDHVGVGTGPDGSPWLMLNKAGWQSTGVINNLPPRVGETPQTSHSVPAGSSQGLRLGNEPSKSSEHDDWTKMAEEKEAGKAAELALREVLGSIEAARSRVTQTDLFDFDFCSMNFPTLCLHLLPPPQTLFSMTPFASSESWSLAAPGHTQLEALQRQLNKRTKTRPSENSGSDVQKYSLHLQDAWNHWVRLPQDNKTNTWQVEILRAYARAEEKTRSKDEELVKAKQELVQLRQQHDQLARGLLPAEFALYPPSLLSLDVPTLNELSSSNDIHKRVWDYDRLVDKWRGAVRASKSGRIITASNTTAASGLRNGIQAQPPASSNRNRHSNTNVVDATHTTPSSSSSSHNANRTSLASNRLSLDDSLPRNATTNHNHHLQNQEDDDDEDADADTDADADADADGEEAIEEADSSALDHMQWSHTSNSHHNNNNHHLTRNSMQDAEAARNLINANGKRPIPAYAAAELRAKGLKMYHDGPMPGENDGYGRAVGQV